MGRIKTVNPRTRAKFAILEPIIFPTARSGLPFKAAWRLTNSSGAEVPNETTVNPITNGDTFKNFANGDRTSD